MKLRYILGILVAVLFALSIASPNFFGPVVQQGAEGQQAGTKQPTVVALSYGELQKDMNSTPSPVKRLILVKEPGTGVQFAVVELSDNKIARVEIPGEAGTQYLLEAAARGNVPVSVEKKELSFLEQYGGTIFTVGLLLFFWILMRRGMSGGGAIQQVTRIQEGQKSTEVITFKDVAGAEEAKARLMKIVRYLENPGRLKRLGGKPPSGVLLIGDPGNGKTLLAKAVAGEAGAEFHEISGSAFVEMFVGVGARRVRDFFQKGREHRPAVIFIDEIDAVGRQRGAGVGGGNDEREQTLNQILVEMDGFNDNEGIVFMAATNRPDILDPALTRPGRFGLHILVDSPDKQARKEIMQVHGRKKKLAEDINFDVIAANTPGFSGAQLAELMNEACEVADNRISEEIAAIVRAEGISEDEAALRVPELVTMGDLDEAADVVQMGPPKKERAKRMSRQDMENTAVHELGHAYVSQDAFDRDEGGDPVTKITIVPRARALGYTMALPEGDRYGYTEGQLRARIKMAMGGRVAQELFLNTIDTGASNDFKQSWNIAYRMVTEWGMSRLGPISIGEGGGNPFLGRQLASGHQVGPNLADEIDSECKRIVNECYNEVKGMLERDRSCFLTMVNVLLEKETILGPEFVELRNKTTCAVPRRNVPVTLIGAALNTDVAAQADGAAPDTDTAAEVPGAEPGAYPTVSDNH